MAVATVDAQGTVTAVSVGTAIITVRTADGGRENVAIVTVTIPVTSVAIDRQSLWLTVGGSETLNAFVFPLDATNRNVTWASGNNSIATVNADGEVTAVAVGETTITVTSECGKFTDTIPVEVEASTTDIGVVINGITWATRNVDAPGTFAANPESAGMFFQWNRNTGWSTTNPIRHWVDNTWVAGGWNNTGETGITWERVNDPCPIGWRVPTRTELQSLDGTGSTWITQNGVSGRLFGIAPNQIFFPAAGGRSGATNGNLPFTVVGRYWTSTYSSSNNAWGLGFGASATSVNDTWYRSSAHSVRCVVE